MTTRSEARDHLRAGHTEDDRERRRLKHLADQFAYSPRLEAMAKAIAEDSDEGITAKERVQVGHYLAFKEAARRLGRDVTGGSE